MTQTLFGLEIPIPSRRPLAPALATALAGRMRAAARALEGGAPVAVAADVRRDAQRYLAARRGGELQLASIATRRVCDDAARALLRLTLDAPAVLPTAARLVA